MADRLRLAVEILNEAHILLVLDNLEALMPLPPAPPRWEDPDVAAFFRELTSRLTGFGRAILTCRYLPEGFDAGQPNLAHEPLPDFTEADFFKYLRRHDKVSTRIDRGELPWDLLTLFHRKLGATPRFVEQASAVLATTDPDRLREQLEGVAETGEGEEGDELRELQQRYFSDLFLPQLYEALPPLYQLALSRLALLEVPIPLDGVASVAGSGATDVRDAAGRWLGLGLVQRFGEPGEVPLFGVYPLQRDFLTDPGRLPEAPARAAHGVAAAFFQERYEKARGEISACRWRCNSGHACSTRTGRATGSGAAGQPFSCPAKCIAALSSSRRWSCRSPSCATNANTACSSKPPTPSNHWASGRRHAAATTTRWPCFKPSGTARRRRPPGINWPRLT